MALGQIEVSLSAPQGTWGKRLPYVSSASPPALLSCWESWGSCSLLISELCCDWPSKPATVNHPPTSFPSSTLSSNHSCVPVTGPLTLVQMNLELLPGPPGSLNVEVLGLINELLPAGMASWRLGYYDGSAGNLVSLSTSPLCQTQ